MERPVEPPAKVRLRNLGHQLNQLRTGEMLPQFLKQPVIDVRRCGRHGNGQVEHQLFDRGESAALPVAGKVLELLFRDPLCSALGRARIYSGRAAYDHSCFNIRQPPEPPVHTRGAVKQQFENTPPEVQTGNVGRNLPHF